MEIFRICSSNPENLSDDPDLENANQGSCTASPFNNDSYAEGFSNPCCSFIQVVQDVFSWIFSQLSFCFNQCFEPEVELLPSPNLEDLLCLPLNQISSFQKVALKISQTFEISNFEQIKASITIFCQTNFMAISEEEIEEIRTKCERLLSYRDNDAPINLSVFFQLHSNCSSFLSAYLDFPRQLNAQAAPSSREGDEYDRYNVQRGCVHGIFSKGIVLTSQEDTQHLLNIGSKVEIDFQEIKDFEVISEEDKLTFCENLRSVMSHVVNESSQSFIDDMHTLLNRLDQPKIDLSWGLHNQPNKELKIDISIDQRHIDRNFSVPNFNGWSMSKSHSSNPESCHLNLVFTRPLA
jgi:hypothetical protein